jgi:hypothetical protein
MTKKSETPTNSQFMQRAKAKLKKKDWFKRDKTVAPSAPKVEPKK